MIKWINGSYAHDLSFGRHRVRKLSTRICVSKGRFGCFLSFHRFTRACRFASNKLWHVNLRVLLFVLQSMVYDQMKKNSQIARSQGAIIKDCRLGNIECSKYQLIFVTRRRFCRSHLFPGWKKTASLFHVSALLLFVLVGRQCFWFIK